MTDTGYVSFFETDCIYIEENDCISIIPKDKDDIKKIRQNFNKQRFFFYLKELKKIANFLVKERGKIAHGGFSGAFSDVDAQKIRFLEIITYAQLLKRIGLKETDIERVIGAVFGCNYILFNENISNAYFMPITVACTNPDIDLSSDQGILTSKDYALFAKACLFSQGTRKTKKELEDFLEEEMKPKTEEEELIYYLNLKHQSL